jgi:STE24 endopeptidase
VSALWGGAVLVGFTLLGGLQALSTALLNLTGPGMMHQILLVVAFAVIAGALDLPLRTTASSCSSSASASTR